MDIGSISLFKTANQKMEWLSARQQVITENIANSDTPGYKAQEVESFESFMGDRLSTGVKTTDPKHISGRRAGSIDVKADDNTWETKPNGNTVSLDQQTFKSNEVSSNYQMVLNLYKKSFALMELAGSGGR